MDKHTTEKHSQQKQFDECDTVLNKNDMNIHKTNVHPKPTFNCVECDFNSLDNNELSSHIKSHEQFEHTPEELTNMESENDDMKRKFRALSDSYNRLTAKYSKLKDEENAKVINYKKELEEAQENFRVA